jgi:hypothetical protein
MGAVLLLLQGKLQSQDSDRSEKGKSHLSVLAALEGVWVARGDGFSSKLTYDWALPGVLLRGRNELRNDAGELVGQYEGHYMWDPGQSCIVFWTVSRDGELHQGKTTWRNEQLWHKATVSGGRIKAYRSVMAVVGRELHYRAKYTESPTDEEILGSPPLIYRPVEK